MEFKTESRQAQALDWRKGQYTKNGSTERVKKLNDFLHQHYPSVDIYRARAYTEAYKENEGAPEAIKRAEGFRKTLEITPIRIEEGELIIGWAAYKPRAVTIKPEYHWWLEARSPWTEKDEIDILDSREHDPYVITDEQRKELKEEILPYWQGKTLFDVYKGLVPIESGVKTIGTGFVDNQISFSNSVSHFCPSYEVILNEGFKYFKEIAQEKLEGLDLAKPSDAEKKAWYDAVIIYVDAIREYAKRYSNLAQEKMGQTSDLQRRKELEKIANMCQRIPYEPPQDFHEALQTFWFTQLLLHIEGTGPSYSPGRFDQYMYPFYKKDSEEGKLTRDKAQELLELTWIKMTSNIWFMNDDSAYFFSGYRPFQNLMIGGVKEDGSDATNELSYLVIDALMETRTDQPTVSVAFHSGMPEKLRRKTAELTSLGMGHPSHYVLDTGVHMLMSRRLGYSLEEARQLSIIGCVEPQGMVKGEDGYWWVPQYGLTNAVQLNLGMAVEMVFTRGKKRLPANDYQKRTRLGVDTGDLNDIRTYEDFEEAVKEQLSEMIRLAVQNNHYADIAQRKFPVPLQSMMTKDCLEQGKDCVEGGARYPAGPTVNVIGVADLANSLAAVKRLVFEENEVTLEELNKALDADFEGHEVIRQKLLNDVPKFGNDEDYVDEIIRRVLHWFANTVLKYESARGHFGGKTQSIDPSIIPVSQNVPYGLVVGALPSGRRAGEPLAEGCSPGQGTDKKGPSAVINSVTKIDHSLFTSGTLLNMWFSKESLENPEGKKRYIDLVMAYCDQGGFHVQFNAQDKETLRNAQKYPERYPTLMVRVAGYSAYFVDLCEEVQNDIIARTEHKL